MGKIISLLKQMGGVWETTINLATTLAVPGKKVLIVDADPQANSSLGVGLDFSKLQYSIYECLMDNVDVRTAICDTKLDNVKILPSRVELVGAEIEMLNRPEREKILKNVLCPVKGEFDYILIDCPPSLGLLTVNALNAADSVIFPVQSEHFCLEGISKLQDWVKAVKSKLNPSLEIEDFLLNAQNYMQLAKELIEKN